jgi:hypothetical protein
MNSLEYLVDDQLLNVFFSIGLLLYVQVVTIGMEQDALIQHLESKCTSMELGTLVQYLKSTMICENSTNANGNRVILNVYPMMKGEKKKMEKPIANASK